MHRWRAPVTRTMIRIHFIHVDWLTLSLKAQINMIRDYASGTKGLLGGIRILLMEHK